MRTPKSEEYISEEVLLAEYEAVYRYCLAICQNENDASDITQEAFLKALWSVKGFEGNCSLYTWLCTIAKNLWINKCKKANRESFINDNDTELCSREISLEQMVSEKDMSKRIHKVLHTLDEPYKEIFTLRVFGELAFSDIAELFSKTESWARVTYHRAKKMIIEILKKDGVL